MGHAGHAALPATHTHSAAVSGYDNELRWRELETAELNGDEISLHTNPVERALFWGSFKHEVQSISAVTAFDGC
ncbi:hypothetical protein C3F00_025190 [Pseudomonas sp. MWU13-2860]|nr:hypothetical protein C3F00_025190 [Pseudomonas sp. MWU13-2860]